MRLSLFAAADDNRPSPYVTPWPDFVAEVKRHAHQAVTVPDSCLGDKDRERPFKTSCPMFSPCEFRAGGRRSTQDAILVHCGVADLDHLTQDQLGDFLVHVQACGLECLVYTGWSHAMHEGDLSLRAIVPFTRPVAAAEWASFWPRMNHALGSYCDPQCKNVDRAYFLPACPTQRLAQAEIYHMPGRPMDVDSVMALAVSPEALAISRATSKVTRDEIMAFQKKLQKAHPDTGAALGRVLRGEAWAEMGHRDNILFKLAGDLAREYPHADPASLAGFFSGSVGLMGDATLEWVQEKIARRQGEVILEQERKHEDSARARRLSIRDAFEGNRDTPYTEEELASFAAQAGCTPEEFKRRWVIQKGGSFYFFVAGKYRGPYGKDDARLAAHRCLAPATSVGVRLEELSAFGEFVQRSAQDLAMDYGSVADTIVVDLTAQVTSYHARTRTLVEAPCPMRPLEPAFNPDVQRWLQLLGGAEYASLELWLAWVIALDRPCAALFLEGPPGCGKSLLAKAVARIWTEGGPTTMEQVMGNWNDALARCPLVFADERMPTDLRGRARTAELREFIQSDVRPYRRKYVADATMKGAARVILAANNRHLLDGEESLTPWDVAAIVGRIVHIQTDAGPGLFAQERGWTPGTGQEDTIARHILWLVENVEKPKHTPRFLVESHASTLHRSMTTSSAMGSAVAHWLVSFLLDPGRLRSAQPGDSAHLIRVHKGALHVNPRAMTDYWDRYKTNVPAERATAKRIMDGIRGISPTQAQDRVSLTVPGFTSRPKFYLIRTEDLVEWANNHGHATPEEILAALVSLDEK